MNWNKLNFDWQNAKFFYVVAIEGSFSSAAKKVNVSQPTLSRHISNLEETLGISLFERSVKGLTLTDSGRDLFQTVEKMANSAQEIYNTAQVHSINISGHVCISANEILASCLLPDVIKKISNCYPDIQLEVLSTDSVSDLSQRDADIALRSFRPSQPDLIVKKIRPLRTRFYATRDYIETLSQPITLESVVSAIFIDFHDINKVHNILPSEYADLAVSQLPLHVHSSTLRLQLLKSGVGIGLMLEDLARQTTNLIDVFPTLPTITFDIWLVARNELKNSPKLKLVFDLVAQKLNGS